MRSVICQHNEGKNNHSQATFWSDVFVTINKFMRPFLEKKMKNYWNDITPHSDQNGQQ